MEKRLPGVYANKIDKKLTNNENVFYSSKNSSNDKVEKKVERTPKVKLENKKNIVQKINSILNSPRYVYKANVKITLSNGEVFKKIIGKNSVHLITIDNELIPISDIIDIEFSD